MRSAQALVATGIPLEHLPATVEPALERSVVVTAPYAGTVTRVLAVEGSEVAVFASDGRALLFPPEAIALKASRTTQGVAVMALKKKAVVTQAQFVPDTLIHNHARYRAKSLPAAGALLREDDRGEEQMSLI